MKKALFFLLIPFLGFSQWTENFDSGTTMPAGWAVINDGGANGWLFDIPDSGSAQSGANVATLEYNATAHDDYLITKAIVVTAGVSDRISFYVKSRASSFLEDYEVLLSTTNQTKPAFTTVLQATQKAPSAWTQKTFSLSAYVGQTVYVAIHATDTDQFEIYADTFKVDSVPTAVPTCTSFTSPTNGAVGVNVDGILNWTSVASATGYKVKVGTTTGGSDIVNNVDAGNVITYNITGNLNASTVYYATITPYNAVGDAIGCSEISFTTMAPPANDNCSAAVVLTVNPDYSCGVTTPGATQAATASTETAPTCGASGTNDDVWFKFTATNTAHRISLTNVSGFTDMAMAAYSGACGGLVEVSCSDPDIMDLTGLTIGQEYKVRVWTYTSTVTTAATFNICVGTPPPPPANDNCSGAIVLTPGATFAQNAVTATNVGATTDGVPQSCQTNAINNVWYSVVVPASGSLTIETKAAAGSTYSDSIINVFSGACGALVNVTSGCNDDDGDGAFSLVNLTGQTPGEVLLVSIWRWGNTSVFDGAFQISAYNASLSTSEVSQAKNNITAYPNPFADVLNISDVKNVKSISIVDIAGRVVKTIEKPSTSLQLRELNSGMYMVILNMNDGSRQTIKAIKK
ncbi:T9SS-dependent choice-of-anchor J family protein [Chryseobacterium sp. 3008163]|uniref:T9SS-dependent choice-of-anchor J family protein n=1 Tax=Chryseobacterium sp. 3008163 TaxID=2478663 RepID=UPI000F0C78DF|nr:choice-of-anchor J domain-containing protein [Chryseobacterium sp. 3008163]AYM99522.1 T9SS C-terminal target domain-containing protein [Chryseobacterium sp. 3008163]